MGRTARDAVKAARSDVAKVISRSMRVIARGIGKRTDEEIKTAFDLPQKEAPTWVHAAMSIGRTFVSVQGQQAAPASVGQLNVVVVGAAASVDAWQEQAKAFQATQRKAIDVVPEGEKSK